MDRECDELTESPSLFDSAAALKRLDGDVPLLAEFIGIFFEDSPGLLQELETQVQARNAHGVQHAAHALKGMLSNFGAEPCVELALELERAGRTGVVSGTADSRVARLRCYWNQLWEELSQFLQNGAHSA